MTRRRGLPLALLLALAPFLFCLLVSSCAVRPEVKTKTSQGPVAAHGKGPGKRIKTPLPYNPGPVVKEAGLNVEKGRYAEALRRYNSALALHPGNSRLMAGRRDALLAANAAAAVSFGKGDFGRAGRLYRFVEDNYRFLAAPGNIENFLEKRLSACGRVLTQRGLESYRKGDLKAAISQWEALLRFDPGDATVRKAADTAKAQLQRLSR